MDRQHEPARAKNRDVYIVDDRSCGVPSDAKMRLAKSSSYYSFAPRIFDESICTVDYRNECLGKSLHYLNEPADKVRRFEYRDSPESYSAFDKNKIAPSLSGAQ